MSILASNDYEELEQIIIRACNRYLNQKLYKVRGDKGLYKILLAEIEPTMLRHVMLQHRLNQVKVAKLLKISRGTLRKKLIHYFRYEFVGTRDEK